MQNGLVFARMPPKMLFGLFSFAFVSSSKSHGLEVLLILVEIVQELILFEIVILHI